MSDTLTGIHAVNADRFRAGEVFGWADASSPTGLSSGIVVKTGPCVVYVRDIRPGIMQRGAHV